MSILTVKHTKLAYNKIIHELTLLKKIVNYFVQFAFFCYYIYLILTHLDSVVHLVLYGVMMAVLIFSFIIELCLKDVEDGTRKEKKERKQNKKTIKLITKVIKYTAKIGTIVLAIIDIISCNHDALFVTLTAVSILVFVGKIVFDVAVNMIERYASMLYLAVRLDIEDSEVIQSLADMVREAKGEPEEIAEDYYTESELATMKQLRTEAGDKEKEDEADGKPKKTKLSTRLFRSIAKKVIHNAVNHKDEDD